MKLEVRNHEVRSSNELPGLPYIKETTYRCFPVYDIEYLSELRYSASFMNFI